MSEQLPINHPIAVGGDNSNPPPISGSVRSLKELIESVSGRGVSSPGDREDAGIAEALPFPFLAIVGQKELKLALILALINPALGGVLLLGPRGTGKTTAVRSLVDLLPKIPRSLCFYGCLPEDIETGGIDAVCPDCAKKFAEGQPLSKMDRVRLVELPLNARLEDVVGGIDERVAVHDRLRLKRGLLAQADKNILYVDEVNLLADEVVDALLDAAAQGSYTVRRGAVSAVFRSRFVLIGSMNPEEGKLRPQIQDRFGLRVIVSGLSDPQERLEAYERVQLYLSKPRQLINQYAETTAMVQEEIQQARDALPEVTLSPEAMQFGLKLISQLKIDSLRAEITLFESGRAYAAADHRSEASIDDLKAIAPMALRLRRSRFIEEYLQNQHAEEAELIDIIAQSSK
ncbi:MAG: ATP-binding protein [Anaerolineaceae bacterium]